MACVSLAPCHGQSIKIIVFYQSPYTLLQNSSFAPASVKALTPIFFQKSVQVCCYIAYNFSIPTILSCFRDEMRKLTEKNPSVPVEVLSWLSRATLDIIGQAGIPLSAVLSRPQNTMRLNRTIGFNYDFDALSPTNSIRHLRLSSTPTGPSRSSTSCKPFCRSSVSS